MTCRTFYSLHKMPNFLGKQCHSRHYLLHARQKLPMDGWKKRILQYRVLKLDCFHLLFVIQFHSASKCGKYPHPFAVCNGYLRLSASQCLYINEEDTSSLSKLSLEKSLLIIKKRKASLLPPFEFPF